MQLSKSFTDIPEHYRIVLTMNLWQIDSWDGNESFRVVIDEKEGFTARKTMGAGGG
jgi:hypothetical protein